MSTLLKYFVWGSLIVANALLATSAFASDFLNASQKFLQTIRGKLENLFSLGHHILWHSIDTIRSSIY